MRFSLGAILALLFASAVAVAQECPAGMTANYNYQGEPESYETSNLSPSGNLSSWDTAPTGNYDGYQVMVGSPFPMAADPALRRSPEHGVLPAEPTLAPPSMAANEATCEYEGQQQEAPPQQYQEQEPQQQYQEQEAPPQQYQEQAPPPQQYQPQDQGNGTGY
jgi:hypothetical protein